MNGGVMTLRLGATSSNFTADTTEGRIDFHEWLGDGWGVLFSHPADFTPVCTTELGETGLLKEQFAKRNARIIAVSVDSVEDHKAWARDIEKYSSEPLNFPIIGDTDRQVSELYDMIHPGEGDTSSVRCGCVIDPNKKIRMSLTYPKSAGRNFPELLRVTDSIQLTDEYTVSTPGNWQDGDDVVIGEPRTEERAADQ